MYYISHEILLVDFTGVTEPQPDAQAFRSAASDLRNARGSDSAVCPNFQLVMCSRGHLDALVSNRRVSRVCVQRVKSGRMWLIERTRVADGHTRMWRRALLLRGDDESADPKVVSCVPCHGAMYMS